MAREVWLLRDALEEVGGRAALVARALVRDAAMVLGAGSRRKHVGEGRRRGGDVQNQRVRSDDGGHGVLWIAWADGAGLGA